MKEHFRKQVLKNGMTILFEQRDLPVISVSITTRCGGVNEDLHEKGISHYIEHMLYKGTKTRSSKELSSAIEKRGGEFNGFTTETMTSFYCKIPSEHLMLALDVLGDMIMNSVFDPQELEKERKVIFEEIKMRRDNPQRYVFDKMHSLLYKGTLGHDLIGTEETMSSITREDILQRFHETYAPHNLILTVVGDAQFEEIVSWAQGYFGEQRRGEVPEYDIELSNISLTEERSGIDQANLLFALHAPLSDDSRVHAAEVLMALMGGGMSSRLFSEIREKRDLAYSVHGAIDASRRYSFMYVHAGVAPEHVDIVRKLILDEFLDVAHNLTQEELDLIKEQCIGHYKISMENSEHQMLQLVSYEIDSRAEDFYLYEEHINAVQLRDVKELALQAAEGESSFFALVPKR